jgi:hypothetical protein
LVAFLTSRSFLIFSSFVIVILPIESLQLISLHEIVDPKHIITKQKHLFHDSKLSLKKSIIFSRLYPHSVAPRNAPSSAKCNVHFCAPQNFKGSQNHGG